MVRLGRTLLGVLAYAFLVGFVSVLFFAAQKDERLREEEALVITHRRHVRQAIDSDVVTKKPTEGTPNTRYDYRRIQANRKSRVQQTCSAMGYDPTFNITAQLNSTLLKQMDFVMAIPELKLIFCYVPKVSCTSWKRLLLALIGYHCLLNESCEEDAHVLARRRFTRMSKLSVSSAAEIFATHTAFFFTRNPYTRVLSAYLEKVLYHPESKIQNNLVQWFADNYPDVHHNHSEPFSFREFVGHYVQADEKNPHWEDMHKLCLPCHIDYDFIGNYETLKPDSDFILDLAEASDDIRFPTQQKPPTYSSDQKTLSNFYSQLSDEDLEALSISKGFATDVTMFGYELPDCIRRN